MVGSVSPFNGGGVCFLCVSKVFYGREGYGSPFFTRISLYFWMFLNGVWLVSMVLCMIWMGLKWFLNGVWRTFWMMVGWSLEWLKISFEWFLNVFGMMFGLILWTCFGCFSNVFGRFLDANFSDVFGCFSDVFGRFRKLFGCFRTFLDVFGRFPDVFGRVSDVFRMFWDVFRMFFGCFRMFSVTINCELL